MSSIDLDGVTIAYSLEGPEDAPVLLFCNSLGTTMAMWDEQAAFFKTQYRVLRYDVPGHGASSSPEPFYSLDRFACNVLRLIDALKIERVHFCGISMGRLIGLWLGINAAGRLNKLIVSNSAPKIGTAAAWLARAASVGADGMNPVADGASSRWFSQRFVSGSPASVRKHIEQLRQCSTAAYAGCCIALADADLHKDILKITAPTLFIAGLYDPITTVEDAQFMTRSVPGATYADLPASHLSNIEMPDAFNRIVRDFLEA